MTIVQALILGILQGITEFLPISSSGHLILAESWLKLDVQALKSFDVAVHFGTLLAILIYFRKDFFFLLKSVVYHFFPRFVAQRINLSEPEKSAMKTGVKTAGYLILATVPAVMVGAFFSDFLDEQFRSTFWVAVMLIAVGVIFFAAEFIAVRISKSDFNIKNTALIGVAQACALIPGVSRSGATISAGLFQGIKRDEAARFSFLLGSIAIAAASALSVYKIFKGDFTLPSADLMLAGIGSSFLAGYAAVAFLMRFLRKHTLHVFGVYRVALGFALLYLDI